MMKKKAKKKTQKKEKNTHLFGKSLSEISIEKPKQMMQMMI